MIDWKEYHSRNDSKGFTPCILVCAFCGKGDCRYQKCRQNQVKQQDRNTFYFPTDDFLKQAAIECNNNVSGIMKQMKICNPDTDMKNYIIDRLRFLESNEPIYPGIYVDSPIYIDFSL